MSTYWNDPAHPNFERWRRGREIAHHRALFVRHIIEKVHPVSSSMVLDIGSGIGGTVRLFSEENTCISLEIDLEKLKNQPKHGQLIDICADATRLPFRKSTFDIIILQDVIEHIGDAEHLLTSVLELLKDDGILYMSTPNRFSIVNVMADPHWGIPLVAMLSRNQIRQFVLPLFRKSEQSRKDFAALYSLNQLIQILSDKAEFRLWTKFATIELFNGNLGIVWSDFHLKLVRLIKKLRLHLLYLRWTTDEPGGINRLFTPTFYFTIKKK